VLLKIGIFENSFIFWKNQLWIKNLVKQHTIMGDGNSDDDDKDGGLEVDGIEGGIETVEDDDEDEIEDDDEDEIDETS
jgi:hypothetical protein